MNNMSLFALPIDRHVKSGSRVNQWYKRSNGLIEDAKNIRLLSETDNGPTFHHDQKIKTVK